MRKVTLRTPAAKCHIVIGKDILYADWLAESIKGIADRVVIFSSERLHALAGEKLQASLEAGGLKVDYIKVALTDKNKNRTQKEELEDKLFELGCTRRTCLVALGGGVVIDLVGFVAATYMRGIPYINIPSTLLAMADSSIGGKTVINTEYGKNTIGTTYHPKYIVSDITLLDDLPDSQFRNGIAEMIKQALIADKKYFAHLLKNTKQVLARSKKEMLDAIETGCRIKKQIIEASVVVPEKSEALKFGHIIAHALEDASDYEISHGRAVAMGMLVEGFAAMKLGVLSAKNFALIEKIINDYKLEYKVNNKKTLKKVLDIVLNTGEAHFVLLQKIGKIKFSGKMCYFPVPADIVKEGLGILDP